MDNHLDIFNDIYAIKDKISDNDFLELNNKLQKLIQENNDLKEKKIKQRRRRMVLIPIDNYRLLRDNSAVIVNQEQRQNREHQNREHEELDEENEELDEENEDFDEEHEELDEEHEELDEENEELDEENEDLDEEHEELDEEHEELDRECKCSRRWCFPEMTDNNYIKYFCLSSIVSLRQCENFKRFILEFPLLENLFEKIDLPFVEEPIYEDYDKKKVVMITRIFLEFIDKINEIKMKSLLNFVLYEYYIRNIRFLIDYPKFAKTTLNKLEKFIEEEPEFVICGQEYNINYKKWYEIIKNIVDSYEQQIE